jgi:hypothetical protein
MTHGAAGRADLKPNHDSWNFDGTAKTVDVLFDSWVLPWSGVAFV